MTPARADEHLTLESWHHMPGPGVLAKLGSGAGGLATAEAARRLIANGPNELKEAKREGLLRTILGQFKSPIVWILIAAGIISAVLGDKVDAIAIFSIIFLNAAIALYQELRAKQSIAALHKMTAPQSKVRREGKILVVPAASIVAGDILTFEAGDLVAADARVLVAASLRCVESALTGEAEAVTKQDATLEQGEVPIGDRKNMVFMGTSVAAGTGEAVVVDTAMKTELGRIAELIVETDGDKGTPLQRKLDSLGHVLIWAALGVVMLLFGLGLLRGTNLSDLTMASISLAVAAVPEGLPAVVTVALSLGVLRMSRRGTLVRKLASVETLGSTNVICTDKTGTLTRGEMTARALYVAGQSYEVTGDGYGPEGEVRMAGKKAEASENAALLELATVLLACNNAHLIQEDGIWKTVGDPTEGALLVAGAKAGGDRTRIEKDLPKHHEIPFDSDRKRSAVIRRLSNGKLRVFINGAPGDLLNLCSTFSTGTGLAPLTEPDKERIAGQSSSLAKQALRVIGSAFRDLNDESQAGLAPEAVEQDLVFVGLTGMFDPPRPEAKDAVIKCQSAGIRIVMITGDHPETALSIAHELGIGSTGTAVSGVDLDKLSDEDLRQRLPQSSLFARVTAAHKLRIVTALKASGSVVAMTGDGVNDAPAIRGADIGIAMGKSGTEVTKQTADMIITDDSFATIVTAVEEGRGIYDNIRKTLQYLLAGNAGELLLMAACVVVGLPAPLLPIHLLWINLATDGLPALCLATDPVDPDVMKRPPRHRSESIVDGAFLRTMVTTSVLTAGVAFATFMYVLKTGSTDQARSSAFGVLVFAELFRALGARSETKPLWRMAFFGNAKLVLVVAASVGLQIWIQHGSDLGRWLKTTSSPLASILILMAVGATPLLVLEIAKVARHALRRTENPRKVQ